MALSYVIDIVIIQIEQHFSLSRSPFRVPFRCFHINHVSDTGLVDRPGVARPLAFPLLSLLISFRYGEWLSIDGVVGFINQDSSTVSTPKVRARKS